MTPDEGAVGPEEGAAAPGEGRVPPVGDPLRFTTLAHGNRRVLGPISDARLDGIVERLALRDDALVVELAPGKAELLVRILRRCPGTRAVGVDRSPWFLDDARRRAAAAGVAARLDLREADARSFAWPDGAADLAIAIGSSGILGDQAATTAQLGSMVRPAGGLVLFGDGVWVREPSVRGMAAFGMERDELPDGLEGQRGLGARAGLAPVWSELVDVAEWDDYEEAYAGAVERWAGAHPDDPERVAFLARAAMMRESYRDWRRACFGFGITLFRRS